MARAPSGSNSFKKIIRNLNSVRAWNKDKEAESHLMEALKIISGNVRFGKDGRILGRGSYSDTEN